LLEKQRDWQVCGEASNGVEAIEKSSNHAGRGWLWICHAVMNGLQAAPKSVEAHPRRHVADQRPGSFEAARMQACSAGYRGDVTRAGGDESSEGNRGFTSPRCFYATTDLPSSFD